NNGGGDGDRKHAQEAANDSAHQQERNEDSDQRNADGQNGETNLFRAFESGGEGVQSFFQVACDVLHDHDSVIHDETCRDGEGHERKIVQAVAAEIHDGECSDKRNRDGDGRDQRSAAIPQENEDNDDYQDDGNHQGFFDVTNRRADSGGSIQNQGGDDSIWNRGLDGGQLSANAIDGLNDIGAGLAKNNDKEGAFAVKIPSD